eukprot:GDKJ01008555.1.p2 GENE.GDKJ01008555.1~~GDKJ01008555.1.p2  ORF type:complete len:103 (-),score=27.16 GDKJ01008555.1:1222-1530(-)
MKIVARFSVHLSVSKAPNFKDEFQNKRINHNNNNNHNNKKLITRLVSPRRGRQSKQLCLFVCPSIPRVPIHLTFRKDFQPTTVSLNEECFGGDLLIVSDVLT